MYIISIFYFTFYVFFLGGGRGGVRAQRTPVTTGLMQYEAGAT